MSCREDKTNAEYLGRRFRDYKNQHVQCRLGGHVPWALWLGDSLAVGGAWPKVRPHSGVLGTSKGTSDLVVFRLLDD